MAFVVERSKEEMLCSQQNLFTDERDDAGIVGAAQLAKKKWVKYSLYDYQ